MSKGYREPNTTKFAVPQLDEEEYHLLFDTLLEDVFKMNKAAAARILGVSIPTISRMDKRAPGKGKQWWWNIILRHIVMLYYADMKSSGSKKMKRRAERIRSRIADAGSVKLMSALEIAEGSNPQAVRFLAALILDQRGQHIYLDELDKPGVRGGYSMRSLRRAAEQLHLVKDQHGSRMIWRFADMSEVDD